MVWARCVAWMFGHDATTQGSDDGAWIGKLDLLLPHDIYIPLIIVTPHDLFFTLMNYFPQIEHAQTSHAPSIPRKKHSCVSFRLSS